MKILLNRSETTGQTPSGTTVDDLGEPSVNVFDRKIYVRDSTGTAQLVADRIEEYSAQKQYIVGDFCVQNDVFYWCTTAVLVPEAFDGAKWTALGGGGSASNSVIIDPEVVGRNTIDVTGFPAVEALEIKGDPVQTEDLQRWLPTQASDTGKLNIDNLGFPGPRFGAAAFRVGEPTHAFTSIGQAATYDGTWRPAVGGTDPVYGILQEVIDANTIIIRQSGTVTDLDTAAFAGGTITPGTVYYPSSTVAGQLTDTADVAGTAAVLVVIDVNKGLTLAANSNDLYVAKTGDVMSGSLVVDNNLRVTRGGEAYLRLINTDSNLSWDFRARANELTFMYGPADGTSQSSKYYFHADGVPVNNLSVINRREGDLRYYQQDLNLTISKGDPILTLNDTTGVLGGDVDAHMRFQADGAAQGRVGFSGTNVGSMVMANEDGSLFLTVETGYNLNFNVAGSTRFRVSESAAEFFIPTLDVTDEFTIDNNLGEIISFSNTNQRIDVTVLGNVQLRIDGGEINAASGNRFSTTKSGGASDVAYAVAGVNNTGMYGAASGDVLRLAANGKEGIEIDGTTTPPEISLTYADTTNNTNVRITSTGVIQRVSSTGRLKKNVREVDLDYMDLKPVMFEGNELSASEDETNYGFIAEQVAEVCENAAERNHNGVVDNYKDRAIIASLTKGLQNMTLRVQQLEAILQP